jgi:hypothetical protein
MENLALGQVVGDRVMRQICQGSFPLILVAVCISTDTADNCNSLPGVETVMVDIDNEKKTIVLSTRNLRMFPEE